MANVDVALNTTLHRNFGKEKIDSRMCSQHLHPETNNLIKE